MSANESTPNPGDVFGQYVADCKREHEPEDERAPRCAWCEDTGGGVTPAGNVEEHFGPMLAARLAERVNSGHGGTETGGRYDALRAAWAGLDAATGHGEASRMVAECAGLREDAPEWAERAAFRLVELLPFDTLRDAMREAFDLLGMMPGACGSCGGAGCYDCADMRNGGAL